MDAKKRAKLEAAGWRFGDAADFLTLTPAERRLVELRVTMARTVRTLRERAGMTQKELAVKLRTTQPRVAKIEQAAPDVSLDTLARSVFALGGRVVAVEPRAKPVGRTAPRG